MPPVNKTDVRRDRLIKKNNPKGEVKDFNIKTKVIGDDFKERGEYIITFSPPLAFDGKYSHSTKSIPDFLDSFMELNDKHDTINTSTGQTHCLRGKRRSLVDVFLVTRTYFPRVGLRTVIREITHNKRMSSNLCQMTLKRVYYYRRGENPRHVQTENKDEFGLTLVDLRTLSAE